MAYSIRRRKIRNKLFAINPNCKYCGVLMVLPQDLPGYQPEMPNTPAITCTINHIYSKLNDKRTSNFASLEICCYSCNQRLNQEDQRIFGKTNKKKAKCQ